MEIEFDEAKRTRILEDRGLDLAKSGEVFEGFHLTRRDDKHSSKEERYHSIGLIENTVVLVTWTPRNAVRRIVTMWKADEKERAKYYEHRDRSG